MSSLVTKADYKRVKKFKVKSVLTFLFISLSFDLAHHVSL